MLLLDLDSEREFIQNGFLPIGVDEVGRGSLAGPVVAGAVVFSSSFFENLPEWAEEITDSKLLSPKKRLELSSRIQEVALGFAFGSVDEKTIDAINIHVATLLAMEEAVTALHTQVRLGESSGYVLVDGKFTLPAWPGRQEAVVDGDAKRLVIAAASIVAKVYRDHYMDRLHTVLPQYGFMANKGYGTAQHLEAIATHGLSQYHRRTFCKRFDQAT
jgi:ribonuclease HII